MVRITRLRIRSFIVWLFVEDNHTGGPLSAMISIRQMAFFRQRVVKRAIKTGNISATAMEFRVSRQSVYRWISRWNGIVESLMDRSHRPKRHPSQQTQKEINMVSRVAHHNKKLGLVCLWVHLKMNYGYSRTVTALYKLLRREGVTAAPKRRNSKPYKPIPMPGERFQICI